MSSNMSSTVHTCGCVYINSIVEKRSIRTMFRLVRVLKLPAISEFVDFRPSMSAVYEC